MIDLEIDGIIFGLQRVGGVSTYFTQLLQRTVADPDIALALTLPRDLAGAPDPALLAGKTQVKHQGLPNRLSRYLPVDTQARVFHSSYYRVPANPRARSVVTVYDFVYERYRRGLARQVHAFQKRAACLRADIILCISENSRADLLEAYPAIDPARARVTPLAVDTTTFHRPDPAPAPTAEVLFVGQRTGYKRFDLAAAAVADAGLSLVVVGPPLTAEEMAMLARMLPGRHRHAGRVDDAQLRMLYAAAHAFIYPSDYEGFGLPILEAQACGCPAVVANRSSFPEVGGNAALYAAEQTADAYADLLRQLGDSTLRASTVDAGLANVRRFSWDRTYAETRAAWRELA